MAPSRPFLHLSTVLFSPPHLFRLVAGIHTCLRLSRQAGHNVRGDSLLGRLTPRLNTSILLARPPTWPWSRRPTRAQTSTRPLRPSRRHSRRRSPRVRILLRRLHSRLLPTLRPPLHHPVHPHARDQPRKPRLYVLCQPAVPCGRTILEFNHILGLQCAAFLASYAVIAGSDAGVDCDVVGVHDFER